MKSGPKRYCSGRETVLSLFVFGSSSKANLELVYASSSSPYS